MNVRDKDVDDVDIEEKQQLNLLLRAVTADMLSNEEVKKIIASLSDKGLVYARKFRDESISGTAFEVMKERVSEWSDETLIFAAKNDVWRVKEWAVNVLEERIQTLPDETLVQTIKDKTDVLQTAALSLIKGRMPLWPEKKLIETAESGIPEIKLLAVEAMKGKGGNAVNAKLKMLESKDYKAVEAAAKALTGINEERVITALMGVLSKDARQTTTEAAGKVLNSTEEGKIAIRKKLGLVE